jgi:hypothetical protein
MATDLATYLNTQTKGTAVPISPTTTPTYTWVNPSNNFLWQDALKFGGSDFNYLPATKYIGEWLSREKFDDLDTKNSLFGLYQKMPGVSDPPGAINPTATHRNYALSQLESLYNLYNSTQGKTNANDRYAIGYDPKTNRWAYSVGGWKGSNAISSSPGGTYYLPVGMGFDTYLNYLKTGKYQTTPTTPVTPTNPVVPANPTDPAIDELRKIIEELQKQIADNQASVEAEKKRIEAEKQARIANRTQALQEAGLWDIVRELYGDNTSDLNAYLDTGAFSRQTGLEDWASQNLTALSESLNKQYADAMKQLQQKAAAAGFGDASWIKGAETALRGQQRGLADVYGGAYDAAALASLLGMDPAYIRGKPWVAPQSITDYGQGFDAFAALDPTLSRLIPGGIDERETPWITTEYQKRDPWSVIFNREDEENNGAGLSGFIRELLRSGRR